jgi:4-hydroxybenzoate polyprenyltransferase
MNQRVTAWLQLLRLPNVFTAAADVTMGYVVTNREMQSGLHFGLLIAASCSLYLSGMVLNDVFDAEVDAAEQPGRPIPSGRISLRAATILGWALWFTGIICSWIVTYLANDWRPGIVATFLGFIILMYDGALKNSRFAPLLMGECRFLNVLLGMSLLILPWGRAELLIAAGVGIYVAGITIFARTDAHISSRARLTSGLIVLLGGISLLAGVPTLSYYRPPVAVPLTGWYLLWLAIGLITARRCITAIFEPSSQRVQAAVRHCVQSVIVIDAAVCVGYASTYWGFVVLAFLVPTLLLTMWLNST